MRDNAWLLTGGLEPFLFFYEESKLTGRLKEGVGLGISTLIISFTHRICERGWSTKLIAKIAPLDFGIALYTKRNAGNLVWRVVADGKIPFSLAIVKI
jgi:hypothetical protein